MIDLHCHILPGIDDGPRNWDQAIELCRAMAGDGITRAFATPHLIDGVYENTLSIIEPLARQLRDRLTDANIALQIDVAAEIDISSRFVTGTDELTPTLASSAILLEMPVAVIPAAMSQILFRVRARGLLPLLAHPERNHFVQQNPRLTDDWISADALLQIDAESLLGIWGGSAQRCAEYLLTSGRAAVLASDAHSVDKRPPRLSAAVKRATSLLGPQATHLVVGAPERIISGHRPEPIKPIQRREPSNGEHKGSWIPSWLRRKSER
jgi:protein-tyrosine phosphatase